MEVPSIKHILSSCLILSLISTVVVAQIVQRYALWNPCTSKSKCHDCIQTPSCAWCTDPEYKESVRCYQPAVGVISNKTCREEFVLNPNNILSVIENLSLTRAKSVYRGGGIMVGTGEGSYYYNETFSATGSSSGSSEPSGAGGAHGRIVQVAPQRLSVKVRAGEIYSVHMFYSQSEDYPVDLYYLMDLSNSTDDYKNKLHTLGNQLVDTMKNLTSNFRLGFGSFVRPHVDTFPEKLNSSSEQRVTPYGFRHHMSLSYNTHIFSTSLENVVQQTNVSGNLNGLKGGLDAIMQAVVCKNHIGWRYEAKKLLVFFTDVGYDIVGDEKLGDIVKSNDGSCHLSQDGIYTESSLQDEPSIEQINLSVKRNDINVIFAVTKNTSRIYEQLFVNIEGASVGRLEGDSSNIVQLIKEQYQQISSTVEMKDTASSFISLKFRSRCLNFTGALVDTNKCENIKVGNIIHFKIDIEVLKCPKNRADHFQTIEIYPVGIDESLIIDLEMLCECNCEQPGHKFYEENSPYCSHQGTYKCGVCECILGRFGTKCDCISEEISRNVTMMDCIAPVNPSGPECSGRGRCVCGRCTCDLRSDNATIFGPFCECDNFSCERHDGKMCSDHGTCECGKCLCAHGWSGSACDCQTSRVDCYSPGEDVIYSGHGACLCGQCVCDYVTEGRYTGQFCEKGLLPY